VEWREATAVLQDCKGRNDQKEQYHQPCDRDGLPGSGYVNQQLRSEKLRVPWRRWLALCPLQRQVSARSDHYRCCAGRRVVCRWHTLVWMCKIAGEIVSKMPADKRLELLLFSDLKSTRRAVERDRQQRPSARRHVHTLSVRTVGDVARITA
jgi:hypothetical protein